MMLNHWRVPVSETLRIINECLLSETTLEVRTSILVVDIMKLLEFCVKTPTSV